MAVEKVMQEGYYPTCLECGWRGRQPSLEDIEAQVRSDAHAAMHLMSKLARADSAQRVKGK